MSPFLIVGSSEVDVNIYGSYRALTILRGMHKIGTYFPTDLQMSLTNLINLYFINFLLLPSRCNPNFHMYMIVIHIMY
jgi:hypothetical protein